MSGRSILTFLFLVIHSIGSTQTLPIERAVDWTLAGLRDTTTIAYPIIDLQTQGFIGDGVTANDAAMSAVLASITDPGAILVFPIGDFLFNSTINIPSNIVMRGQGADNTTLTLDLGGNGHSINAQGSFVNSITPSLTEPAEKDSNYLVVSDTSGLSRGEWIRIIQQDGDLVTSYWAEGTVGQIVQIEDVVNDTIVLASPLRMSYDLARSPYIMKIDPVHNVGIECLKIIRVDDAYPLQSSNIHFSIANNCWVNGIESFNCTFSHIE